MPKITIAKCLNPLCGKATELGRYYCGEYCAYHGMLIRSDGKEAANEWYINILAAAREKNHKNNIRLKESKND